MKHLLAALLVVTAFWVWPADAQVATVWTQLHGKLLPTDPPGTEASLSLLAPINGMAYGTVGIRLTADAPVTVTVGTFTGPAVIPANLIHVYYQVPIWTATTTSTGRSVGVGRGAIDGEIPDPLLPLFDDWGTGQAIAQGSTLAAERSHGFLLVVWTDDLPAGNYTGSLTVSWGADSQDVSVALRVAEVVLPKRTMIPSSFRMMPQDIVRFYGFPWFGGLAREYELIRNYRSVAVRFRLTPVYEAAEVFWSDPANGMMYGVTYGLSETANPDGTFSYTAIACWDQLQDPFCADKTALMTDHVLGILDGGSLNQDVTNGYLMGNWVWIGGFQPVTELWPPLANASDQDAALTAIYQAVVANMKRLGVMDSLVWYLVDEPNGSTMQELITSSLPFIRDLDPDFWKSTLITHAPVVTVEWPQINGLLGTAATALKLARPYLFPWMMGDAEWDEARAAGMRQWYYDSNAQAGADYPTLAINAIPEAEPIAMAWTGFAQRIAGHLYWGTLSGIGDDLDNRFGKSGDGYLMYAGAGPGYRSFFPDVPEMDFPLPSLRLVALAVGVNDWSLLQMAEARGMGDWARAWAASCAREFAEAWTEDPDCYDTARAALLAALEPDGTQVPPPPPNP